MTPFDLFSNFSPIHQIISQKIFGNISIHHTSIREAIPKKFLNWLGKSSKSSTKNTTTLPTLTLSLMVPFHSSSLEKEISHSSHWLTSHDSHCCCYSLSLSLFDLKTLGDLPLDCHLKFINENVFCRFTLLKQDDKIPSEVRLSQPKFVKITGPPSRTFQRSSFYIFTPCFVMSIETLTWNVFFTAMWSVGYSRQTK